MTPEPVLPDYAGANISNLVPALLDAPGQRPEWLPGPARSAEQVVLLLLDGLGWLQLEERRGLAPVLSSMAAVPITTVAPSTTSVALTSLTVGRPPAEHGVVGYRVVVAGPQGPEVMNVLRWRLPTGNARDLVKPRSFQPIVPFGGRQVPVVSRSDFAGSGFSEAHQHDAPVIAFAAASAMAVDVRRLLVAGEPLVYAYYEGIDKTAHMRGFGEHFDAELKAADGLVAELLEVLPRGAALVVTADHGQVEVRDRVEPVAPEVMELLSMMSGEARFRWLHARDAGSKTAIARIAEAALHAHGDRAWVATIEQVEEEGWLGGRMSEEVRSRLGDVALVPFDPIAYLDPTEDRPAGDRPDVPRLACRHGSLTAEEMFVPLAAGGRLEG